MVVFGVIANKENKLLNQLIEEYNYKLSNNNKMIEGQVYWQNDEILVFKIINYSSPMFDLPRWITYKAIQIRWRRKGYKQTFKLIKDQKLLHILVN